MVVLDRLAEVVTTVLPNVLTSVFEITSTRALYLVSVPIIFVRQVFIVLLLDSISFAPTLAST